MIGSMEGGKLHEEEIIQARGAACFAMQDVDTFWGLQSNLNRKLTAAFDLEKL